MRTIGNALVGGIVVVALVGATLGAELRTRAGCACVLVLAGMWVGAGLVREEGGE